MQNKKSALIAAKKRARTGLISTPNRSASHVTNPIETATVTHNHTRSILLELAFPRS
jgi:hypothetical protein